MENKTTLFVCPVCAGTLTIKEKSYVCQNGHSFDMAKQGYVHLLKPNQMHSKIPGDNKQMVDSRRDFLQKGYYDIFREKLCDILGEYIKNSQTSVILDAGCGEGYYTSQIQKTMDKSTVMGFDISKFAVKAAAGKYKAIEFAVASIFNIPVMDKCADCVVNIFAPIVEGEFCRVLKKGGVLIIAVPGKNHLFELKKILYDNPYVNEEKETEYKGFEFLKRVAVKGRAEIPDNKTLWDLFSMTPYFWKTDVKGGERLKTIDELSTEIHFDFLVYRKI